MALHRASLRDHRREVSSEKPNIIYHYGGYQQWLHVLLKTRSQAQQKKAKLHENLSQGNMN